jgi:hypothetical protein
MPDVETAAGALPALLCGGFGELRVQSGQVRQDPVLSDIGVLGQAEAEKTRSGRVPGSALVRWSVPRTIPMPIRRSCGLPGRPSVHDGRDDAVVTPKDQVVQVG